MAFYPQYGGYGNPYYPQPIQVPAPEMRIPQQPQQPQNQQNNGLTWVQGEAAVKSRYVAPGTSNLFMDSEAPVFYIKTVDVSGMPQPLRIFDYKERTGEEQQKKVQTNESTDYVTRAEFDALKNRIDNITNHTEKEAEEDG